MAKKSSHSPEEYLEKLKEYRQRRPHGTLKAFHEDQFLVCMKSTVSSWKKQIPDFEARFRLANKVRPGLVLRKGDHLYDSNPELIDRFFDLLEESDTMTVSECLRQVASEFSQAPSRATIQRWMDPYSDSYIEEFHDRFMEFEAALADRVLSWQLRDAKNGDSAAGRAILKAIHPQFQPKTPPRTVANKELPASSPIEIHVSAPKLTDEKVIEV